jgi:hypothetical protein
MKSKDNPERINLNIDRIKYWLSVGAKPTDRVAKFLSLEKIVPKPKVHPQTKQDKPKPKTLEKLKAKEEKAKAKVRQRGEESSSEEEEEANDASDESGSSDDGGVSFGKEKVTTKKKPAAAGAQAESSSGSSEEESSSDEERKAKGVEGLIEIENPNLRPQRQKKVTELSNASTSKAQLTRREREEVEKQKAKAHYQKLHAAGKTEEARADLARLAIIRKQREGEGGAEKEENQEGQRGVT